VNKRGFFLHGAELMSRRIEGRLVKSEAAWVLA